MACEIISCEGAVFVLWGKPTVDDVARVMDRLELIAEKSGRKIVYLTRVPVDAPPPDEKVRKALEGVMPRAAELCSFYSIILEGDGFVSAVKRGVLTGLLMLGWSREQFRVCASPIEVLPQTNRRVREDVERIHYLAGSKGLLTYGAPDGPDSGRERRSLAPNQQLRP